MYLNEVKLEPIKMSFSAIRNRWYIERFFSTFLPINVLLSAIGIAGFREHRGMTLYISRDAFIKLEIDRIQTLFFRKSNFRVIMINVYPVESLTIYGGGEEKNVHSLSRVGFKASPFLTGFI
jgi:hypothetical protein